MQNHFRSAQNGLRGELQCEVTRQTHGCAAVRKRFLREARLGMVASFERRSDWASVKEQLAGLLNDDPNNGSFRQRLAEATFHMGQPEAAFADFQKAYQDDPATEPAELRIAKLWLTQGNRDQAETWLKKAVSAHGSNPKTHRAYTGFLLDDGNLDAAPLYLAAAVKLDAKARETVTLQALLLRYKKEYPAAEVAFEQLH